ncbi:MAG TPA: DUF3347 domain-containing protein [Chitinophagaceae bacterium]|nr:DUF3347 domain-containing protein [Chitinophagaceae bacterium]
MKNILFGLAVSTLFIAACNNGTNSSTQAKTADSNAAPATTEAAKEPGVSASTKATPVKEIVSTYLQMKNAFAIDNDKDAAVAGDAMVQAFGKFDKASLTPEQSRVYTDIEDDAKEHAEHIGKNVGNIRHQREHFEMLSKDVYQLVKTFGSGQELYYDHCPMYNNNKGADWISETKEIKNPYLGKSMPTCGSIKEEIKQ